MMRTHRGIDTINGDIASVFADGVGFGELAVIRNPDGEESLAQVVRLAGRRVALQVFSGTRGLSVDASVRFLGRPMQLRVSQQLLGRVFDGSGRPRDGKPSLDEGEPVELAGPSVNPIRRRLPGRLVETGIPMIDVFNPLVESQKLPIFSEAGEPHAQLLARIGLQARADVIVFGGIGLPFDEAMFFQQTFEEGGVMGRTVMFVNTAADPVVERLLVPDLALAAAEQLAVAGQRVLVLLTDMTAFADALKEIAVSMEQIPSNLGFPGSLYSDLAARYEKAVDLPGAGSITILGVTTMPGGDVTHPVPDNTGYITEGQYYLTDGCISPFGSLSRLGQLVVGKATRDDHGPLMNAMIRLYARAQEAHKKLAMGFMSTETDARHLRYGELFRRHFMDLEVELPLLQALDLGWRTLAECYEPQQVGIKREVLQARWPGEVTP
ncbi:V-type ATP synthase subunit B [Paraliomyxa miuraensis]|uniref:V-type ATP synthase subunit B n=1 Tax=Paraliomyxa miuraensis TaxID=376150 RepID=UPI00224E5A99|nr:V-type ATP synthase subunit B [Paraliomyxa miuraensis]MCX4247728.1 V-type ATP synthase subunit B [Paraliomyxa miuraensis]